jgi:hypothetical protein
MRLGVVCLRKITVPIALLALTFPAAAAAAERDPHMEGIGLRLIRSGDTEWHVFREEDRLLMIRVVPDRGLPHYFVPAERSATSASNGTADAAGRDSRSRDVRRVDWTQASF